MKMILIWKIVISSFLLVRKVVFALQDMDYRSWKVELEQDFAILTELEDLISKIKPQEDQKLQTLFSLIDEKLTNPINLVIKS